MDFDIRFRQMSDNEFDRYMEWSILDFSKDLVKAGRCNEDVAYERSKAEFDEMLPQGKNTVNNFIYVMVNTKNEDVGFIWYKKCFDNEAFICDFLILEEFRKKGYGKQTLLLIENEAKEKKISRIALNVFKFNLEAMSLYNYLGYKMLKEDSGSMYMVKDI